MRCLHRKRGADARMVGRLDDALSHLADVTEEVLKTDNRNLPGAGAAGGLGFAFASYLGGDLRPGVGDSIRCGIAGERIK